MKTQSRRFRGRCDAVCRGAAPRRAGYQLTIYFSRSRDGAAFRQDGWAGHPRLSLDSGARGLSKADDARRRERAKLGICLTVQTYHISGGVQGADLPNFSVGRNIADSGGESNDTGSTLSSGSSNAAASTALPAGAQILLSSAGVYSTSTGQVQVQANGGATPTGNWGGTFTVSSTNNDGIAYTDYNNPETLLIDRTYYGSFEFRVGYAGRGMAGVKSSFPAIRKRTVRMVLKRV
jgi:hypothetical protein